MASTLGAFISPPWTPAPISKHHHSLLSKPQLSISSRTQPSSASGVLSLAQLPSPWVPSKWKLSVVAESPEPESTPEPEEAQAVVGSLEPESAPEPVEAQVASSLEPEPKEAQAVVESLEPESAPELVEAQVASLVEGDGPKGEDVFAVVMIGSRQYIVFPGRFLYTQRLKGANLEDKIILNKVLLVGTRSKTYIGQPVVTNAAVHAVVEEQGLDPKVIVFKYKKKKNYRRTIGHRQPNTRIRITGITGYQDFPAETLPA